MFVTATGVFTNSKYKRDILRAIYQHHERMDGNGYPEGISGESIHNWARIISIADVYDAVTTNRVYRESPLPHDGAEVLMGSIGQLDYGYIKAFFNNMPIYPSVAGSGSAREKLGSWPAQFRGCISVR